VIIAVLFVTGLYLGSFANAMAWRIRERHLFHGLSILTSRSRCSHCGRQLLARDLVPVASFVALRGRCRYCGQRIEDDPALELGVAALFPLSYVWWPARLLGAGLVAFVLWLLVAAALLTLAVSVVRWQAWPRLRSRRTR
jgi:prepilin signal peptidase PulO-like enzyme (type II secretory pathway)